MSQQQLADLVNRVRVLKQRLSDEGPTTDDELHAWIRVNIGISIPRVAVCKDHVAPFKFISDLYFERVKSALGLANRGGSKTLLTAVLHYLNSTFKPGCQSLQFGATEAQGMRCYSSIEDWCYKKDDQGRRLDVIHDYILDKPMKSSTQWKSGSKVEVVPGSAKAVSGPHPQKAGADEVDLMEDDVWVQSRGMTVSGQATGKLPSFMDHFNGIIPPQDIATSTRNSRSGLMQELIEEINEDLKRGTQPQFTLFAWCIFEVIQEVPNCRQVDVKDREARLIQLGKDPCSLCECNQIVKGRLPTGEDRTLETVCQGRAFKSRGFKPFGDFAMTFKRNTPGTWLLQHECREGMDENNYIEGWDLNLYGIKNYRPDPKYGPIYQGIDWGGHNPHAVLWFQYLKQEVAGLDHQMNPVWLAPNTYILFREIYVADIDTAKLADRTIAIEQAYRKEFPGWKVKARFMDPQGKADRLHFARRGMPGSWPFVSRNKEQMITIVQNVVMDDRLAVDSENAPMFSSEIGEWGKNPKTGKEIDASNHAMSAFRYAIANAEVYENPGGKLDELPRTLGVRSDDASKARISVMRKQQPAQLAGRTETVGPIRLAGRTKQTGNPFQQVR